MKKALFILLLLPFLAFSQDVTLISIQGGVTIEKNATNQLYYYSNGSQMFANIDYNGKVRIYNKNGASVFGSYDYDEWEIDGVIYADADSFILALNQIPIFSYGSGGSGGGSTNVYCGDVYPIDSGEVIGDFMYIFSGGDTTIIDVSSLAGGGGGGDSLWHIVNGKLEPIDEQPFVQKFGDNYITNDSLDIGLPSKLPFNGFQSADIGSYKGFAGYVDASGIGQGEIYIMGYADFFGQKNNNISFQDTTSINVKSNNNFDMSVTNDGWQYGFSGYREGFLNDGSIGTADHFAFDIAKNIDVSGVFTNQSNVNMRYNYNATNDTAYNSNSVDVDSSRVSLKFDYLNTIGSGLDLSFNLDSNGVTLPIMSDEPTGTNGAMYYNSTTDKFRAYQDGIWEDVIYEAAPLAKGLSSPIGSVVPASVGQFYYDTVALKIYIAVGVLNTDWVVLN